MSRVGYLKDKLRAIKHIIFSHSYIVVTDDHDSAHIADDKAHEFRNVLIERQYAIQRHLGE